MPSISTTPGEADTEISGQVENPHPLETLQYVVKESDKLGGPGGNFIMRWHPERPANVPIIESVMICTGDQQGISFISRSAEIDEK